MTEVILSLGSNQGVRYVYLQQAVAALRELPHTALAELSPIYESTPLEVPEHLAQTRFLNQIAILQTELTPLDLLEALQAIESHLGRVRGEEPNMPRTIDLDIVAYGTVSCATPRLTLPHPRACVRRFVLQPLLDLRPDFCFPDTGLSAQHLLGATAHQQISRV